MRLNALPAPRRIRKASAFCVLRVLAVFMATLALLVALATLQGCGTIYTPGHATGMASGKKTGIGICKNFFYFFDFGDCTIAAAARNGFPYIYTKRTTIVTGE